jgi:hypothetical protein
VGLYGVEGVSWELPNLWGQGLGGGVGGLCCVELGARGGGCLAAVWWLLSSMVVAGVLRLLPARLCYLWAFFSGRLLGGGKSALFCVWCYALHGCDD